MVCAALCAPRYYKKIQKVLRHRALCNYGVSVWSWHSQIPLTFCPFVFLWNPSSGWWHSEEICLKCFRGTQFSCWFNCHFFCSHCQGYEGLIAEMRGLRSTNTLLLYLEGQDVRISVENSIRVNWNYQKNGNKEAVRTWWRLCIISQSYLQNLAC